MTTGKLPQPQDHALNVSDKGVKARQGWGGWKKVRYKTFMLYIEY